MSGLIVWSPGVSLEAIERQVIERAWEHYRGNKTATANALGIAIRTLESRLERYEADKKLEVDIRERERQTRDTQLARARGIIPSQNIEVRPESATSKAPFTSFESQAGVRMEPTTNAPAESAVSMPERSEVQEVLSPKVAAGGSRGRR